MSNDEGEDVGKWERRIDLITRVVNRVGIPSILVLVATAVAVAIIMGKIDPPVVTKAQFREAVENDRRMHEALVDQARQQTETQKSQLKQNEVTTDAIRSIACELKGTDKERLNCYRER